MNILIAIISTFGYNTQEREYTIRVPGCDVETIKAVHTNESILKCLVHLESVRLKGGLGKVIALVSNSVKTARKNDFKNITALEYFQYITEKNAPGAELVTIDIENEKDEPIETAVLLQKICANISASDNVYIDCAGGKRTTNYIVQVLTKMLNYTGVNTPCTLYSDIQNNVSFIIDTKEYEQMTDLADAFNEFMTTGKADQLSGCFVAMGKESPFRELINAMVKFSDRIRLGNVKDIDHVIKELTLQVEKCKDTCAPDSIETVMLMQFLPVIESKIIGSCVKGIDYVKIINWCLENMLIQQALTLFVEKLPIYVFNNEMIKCRFDVEKAKNVHSIQTESNKTLPKDWETYAFYSDCLENRLREVPNSEISEFIDCLMEIRQPSTKSVQTALSIIFSYRKKYPLSNITDKRKNMLDDFIKEKSLKAGFESFVNAICKNRDFVNKYLSTFSFAGDKKEGDKTLNKKFSCVEEMENEGFSHSNYDLNIRVEKLIEMYYAYIYAKALRNKINHASSEEILAEWQMGILSQHGYDFSFFDIKSLKRNIEIALGYFVVDIPGTELRNLTDNTLTPRQ